MKKFILVALMLVLASPVFAGGWLNGAINNVIAGGSDAPNKATTMYRIETMGNDVRLYEWTPQDNKNIRCIFAAGSENSTGVACYEVEEKKKR
jgi:hypothetical protein